MATHRPPGRPRKTHTTPRPHSEAAVYEVGQHEIRVFRNGWAWTVAVDARSLTGRFESQAEAWAAGVAAVDQMDRAASGDLSISAA